MQRIDDLTGVKAFRIAAGDAEWIGITASGTSPSGWRNPVLSPWLYTERPADNIQDFDFYADAPVEIVNRYQRPLLADELIERSMIDYWGENNDLVGVRVHTRRDTIEARFSGAAPVDPSTLPIHVQTAGVPWSWTGGRGVDQGGRLGSNHARDTGLTSLIGTRLRLLDAAEVEDRGLRTGHTNIQIDAVTRTIKKVWID